MSVISRIRKRDNRIVNFDQNKITEAIWKAAQSVGGTDRNIAEKIANQVATVLEVFFKDPLNVPSVEQIQDLVEKILIENGHAKTAKAYILYRAKHHQIRQLKTSLSHLTAENKGISVQIDFPANANIEQIKDVCSLAYEFGCQSLSVKSSKETKILNRQKEVITTTKNQPETQETLPFHEINKTKPAIQPKKAEEVVLPPIQSSELYKPNNVITKSELVEIPMISSL